MNCGTGYCHLSLERHTDDYSILKLDNHSHWTAGTPTYMALTFTLPYSMGRIKSIRSLMMEEGIATRLMGMGRVEDEMRLYM